MNDKRRSMFLHVRIYSGGSYLTSLAMLNTNETRHRGHTREVLRIFEMQQHLNHNIHIIESTVLKKNVSRLVFTL